MFDAAMKDRAILAESPVACFGRGNRGRGEEGEAEVEALLAKRVTLAGKYYLPEPVVELLLPAAPLPRLGPLLERMVLSGELPTLVSPLSIFFASARSFWRLLRASFVQVVFSAPRMALH
jgi:hypothetical protein